MNFFDQDPEPYAGPAISLEQLILLVGSWYLWWQLVKLIYGAHDNKVIEERLANGVWPVIIVFGWTIALALIVGYQRSRGIIP
jgi:hypothetical protein